MDPQSQAVKERRAPGHPYASLFHLLFKGVAIVFYIVCEMIGSDSFVTNFVVCLLFISADFWVVKNVTGRLMVGLRWWNDVSEEGEGWRFESLTEGQRGINRLDKTVFWGGLVGNVVAWVLLTIPTLFSIADWPYLLVCGIAILMGSSNLYGYFKCSAEARKAVSDAQNALVSAAVTSAASAALGGSSGARGK